jgi:hypothetical protein
MGGTKGMQLLKSPNGNVYILAYKQKDHRYFTKNE